MYYSAAHLLHLYLKAKRENTEDKIKSEKSTSNQNKATKESFDMMLDDESEVGDIFSVKTKNVFAVEKDDVEQQV